MKTPGGFEMVVDLTFTHDMQELQGSAERCLPGLVSFVTALAYYFCLALPGTIT